MVEDEAEAAPAEAAGEGAETGEPVERGAMRYRRQRRAGKGVRDIKTSERNGPVAGVAAVRDGDEVMLITVGGMVTRSNVDSVRVTGRNTQEVRVMSLNAGVRIATLARVAPGTGDDTTAVTEA